MLTAAPPLNITLERPIKMARPIRILFRTGNFDGTWQCDVPCEYTTNEDNVGREVDGKQPVDVVVGEAGPPSIASAVRAANPMVATAARSMESAVNYPSLKRLPEQVDAPMTTNMKTAAVPVIYLTRSSIAKWGGAPIVWNASALTAHYGRGSGGSSSASSSSRSAASFVARNCHSKNGRESAVKKLSALLRGGVDRPGLCLNTVKWPKCDKGKKCGKHALLRRYPFYLAFENSDEEDYVSEKVFHALEAGVLPVYNGAPNIADFVPPHSVVDVKDEAFGGNLEKVAAHLHSLLDDPAKYLEYFAWKSHPMPEDFQKRFGGLVGTHAKCRLCRWAYARKYKLEWSQAEQRPLPTSGLWF